MVLGEHDLSVDESTEQRRRVAAVQPYRVSFGRSRGPKASLKSDIALVRLDRPAIFTDFVQPIELPEPSDDFTGENPRQSLVRSDPCNCTIPNTTNDSAKYR